MKRVITILAALFLILVISSCAHQSEPTITPTDGGIGGTGKPIV